LNIISLVGGLLLFFGILVADVSFKGIVLDGWTLIFVATAALLSFANIIFIVTRVKRREKILLSKIAPQQQAARSGPQPKETREEE